MRTLNKNKTRLWYVDQIGTDEKVDLDGFYTGEMIPVYSEPTEIYIGLYPSTGTITEQLFGKDASFDMIAISTNVDLNENALLYLELPTETSTYDYKVDSIKKSLNVINYGLRRRV